MSQPSSSSSSSSSSSASTPSSFLHHWKHHLTVGDELDVLDTSNNWCTGSVVEVQSRNDHLQVHYHGWHSQWDESIARYSHRLAPLNTRAPSYRPKISETEKLKLKATDWGTAYSHQWLGPPPTTAVKQKYAYARKTVASSSASENIPSISSSSSASSSSSSIVNPRPPLSALLQNQESMLLSSAAHARLKHLLFSPMAAAAHKVEYLTTILGRGPIDDPDNSKAASPSLDKISTSSSLTRPDLSFYDSARKTVMMLIIQLLHTLDESSLKSLQPYLPCLKQSIASMDVNHADENGLTLLHYLMDGPFSQQDNLICAIVEHVLDEGGDISLLSHHYDTCLTVALKRVDSPFTDVRPIFQLLRCNGSHLITIANPFTQDTHLHRMIRTDQRALARCIEVVLSDYYQHGGDIFATNCNGDTIFSIIASQAREQSADLELRLSIELVVQWLDGWKNELAPHIQRMLLEHIPNDLCEIVVEYIDGSGKPFPPPSAVDLPSTSLAVDASSVAVDGPAYEVGMPVDVLDLSNEWHMGRIIQMGSGEVKVNYIQWTSQWDEWVPLHRIAPSGSHQHEYKLY